MNRTWDKVLYLATFSGVIEHFHIAPVAAARRSLFSTAWSRETKGSRPPNWRTRSRVLLSSAHYIGILRYILSARGRVWNSWVVFHCDMKKHLSAPFIGTLFLNELLQRRDVVSLSFWKLYIPCFLAPLRKAIRYSINVARWAMGRTEDGKLTRGT
jgi:hypothetical protein